MKRREFVGRVAAGGAAAGLVTAWRAPDAADGARTKLTLRLDEDWRFLRDDAPGAERIDFDDSAWEHVSLPHGARIEALVTGPPGTPGAQWQGACWYRRRIALQASAVAERAWLRFEGAMNVADVWLNGVRVGGHLGGYLPFTLDVTEQIEPGHEHVLAVRLDNRDNPITGPKPLGQLDFNIYHGLYRPVFLVVSQSSLHITDPLLEGGPASGGLFVTYPDVSREHATVRVKTHARNSGATRQAFRVRTAVLNARGDTVVDATSELLSLEAGADRAVVLDLVVTAPRLWSPADPNLHTVHSQLIADAGHDTLDWTTERIGIRRIAVGRDGIRINGEHLFLRGANRHQEYPYLGYAISDAAQYRDARKIKEAGFDYIRLSHYPHAPAFMDACDELGLVVMNCIPGWQYFNRDPAFIDLQYQNCRDLVRRDRNHPCVVLWEVSLNESGMTPEFIARTHAIAHEEYPGDQCFTAGWMHGYDVFIDARQHGGCRREHPEPCLVSEYGDWEYYAMNAGLAQDAWQNLSPAESNSRQLRWQGERALLQQAANFQEAHNDNIATGALGDGLWVMFDYNRGYSPDIETSGCMDIFRLPKFSSHFFRSQRDPSPRLRGADSGPMVFIASYWTPESDPTVRVFSNCDEVALSLVGPGGRLIERKGPDQDRTATRLAHPPFTFHTGGFRAGTLEAVGYIAGRRVARHVVRTPGVPARLALAFDFTGRAADSARKDHLFCYASLLDARGTVVPTAWENVAFGATGGVSLIGANPFATEAGIASIVVEKAPGVSGAVFALTLTSGGPGVRVLSAALDFTGRPPRHETRRTAAGAELLVQGRVVASLDAGSAKLRIPISAPPDRREPFRR